MSGLSIILREEGDPGSGLKAKNLEGEDYRDILQNQGDHGHKFIARAEIVGLVSGKTSKNEKATLVILRFTFLSLNKSTSRRFTSAIIKVEFSDFKSRTIMDPEVYKISPDNVTHLDKITLSKDVEWGVTGGVKSGGLPVGLESGATWKVSKRKDKEHWAKLAGTKWNNRSTFTGADNTAIWQLEEHSAKKQGIPSFLQTAVLLKRKNDEKIQMKISINSNVDAVANAKYATRKLFGNAEPEPMDPVHFDSQLFRIREISAEELEKDRAYNKLEEMDRIDLSKYTGVVPPVNESDKGDKAEADQNKGDEDQSIEK